MARKGSPNSRIPDFDETFDVVVVGFGFAGAFSAIHAADAGCRVLLAEKQAMPGGISICSYGSMRCARDVNDAFAYLKATNAERTPDDIIRMLADGMTKIEQEIRDLASTTPTLSKSQDSTTPKRYIHIFAAADPAMAGAC